MICVCQTCGEPVLCDDCAERLRVIRGCYSDDKCNKHNARCIEHSVEGSERNPFYSKARKPEVVKPRNISLKYLKPKLEKPEPKSKRMFIPRSIPVTIGDLIKKLGFKKRKKVI